MGILHDINKMKEQNIKLPLNELLWLTYLNEIDSKIKYFITSDKIRENYYLYEVIDDLGNIKKIKTDKQPLFEKYIKI